MARGCLSKAVQEVAQKFWGRDITVRELRLIPYLHCTMCNEQRIDSRRLSFEEINLVMEWESAGYISYKCDGSDHMTVTKEFWDFMCDVMWLSYVLQVE